MSREYDGAIRFTGEAIDCIKRCIEKGTDVYEEGALYFNFDKFFTTPEELLDSKDDKVATAFIHGIAALNPESSFNWGQEYPKFETIEAFNEWFDHLFNKSLRKTKKELEEMGYIDCNLLTQPDKLIEEGRVFSLNNNGLVDEEELKAIFSQYPTLVKKHGCIFRNGYNPWAWAHKLECGYWEKNGVGYLSFSLFNRFPIEIAIKLSRDVKDQEVGVEYSVEDLGADLYVFKNGKLVFEDYYCDDGDYNEDPEGKTIDENPTSISFENFYQREDEKELSEEEKEERRKCLEGDRWCFRNKDKLSKNSDGTYVITEDMPEGAKIKILKENEIIVARANQPTYEEIVRELGRDQISMEEKVKAITWLKHHEHLTDGLFYTVVTKDMPILVKAYILFERKGEEKHENDEDDFC